MIEFLFILALIGIFVAIIQDFRFREVANWLNFSLLISALVFRIFYSVLSENEMILIFGLVGLAISFVVGHLLYYGRLFAGGDAKLFIALGVILPFSNNFRDNNLIFLVFLIALLFGGSIYSLIYSVIISFRNWKSFSKTFTSLFKQNKTNLYSIVAFSIAFIFYSIFSQQFIFLIIPLFLSLLFFTYLYAKAVEKSCMLKEVEVKNLKIGDWLEKEIKVKNKIIKLHWEGLSEEEIVFLKKNCKEKILIKDGVPFTPAFLIAFLVIIFIQFKLGGNWGLWGFF